MKKIFKSIRPSPTKKKISFLKSKTETAKHPLHIIPFGGCGEFGMNLTCYVSNKRFIVVDAGSVFPEAKKLGVSSLIPHVKHNFPKLGKLEAYVVTHGHEDHIGALAFLYNEMPAPIYATPWTAELIKRKFERYNFAKPKIHVVRAGDKVTCFPFTVEYIHVNHSIPDACALYIKVSGAKVFHSGDFKIDKTPPDNKKINYKQIERIKNEGITALLTDSTNSLSPGYGPSEMSVVKPLEKVIQRHKDGRVFIATFASNYWRVKSIIDICHRLKKKLFIDGRGLNDSLSLAEKIGMLKVPKDVLVTRQNLSKVNRKNLVVLATGSQGEERSSLYRIANKEHKLFSVDKNDLFIFSARAIPGNEKGILKLTDEILREGASIVNAKVNPDIHVSGHAYQDELKTLIKLVKPQYYIPVHGTYSLLLTNANLAQEVSRTIQPVLLENGEDILISNDKVTKKKNVKLKFERYYVDSESNHPISEETLNERLQIGELGLVNVFGVMKAQSKKWLKGPFLEFKGLSKTGNAKNANLPQKVQQEFMKELSAYLAKKKTVKTKEVEKESIGILRSVLAKFYNKRPVVLCKIISV
ncbi:MAG: hypothetical protein CMP11_00745 [Zetaproteobacteria bacterium]|nr:hypothetical protein [Pseudobdellovibrionaceae bacterium]